jgi:hypothetical protein
MAAKPEHEGLVAWCEGEIAMLKAELAELEAGTVRMGKSLAHGEWEDITPKHAAWIKEKIAQLDELIVKYSFPI